MWRGPSRKTHYSYWKKEPQLSFVILQVLFSLLMVVVGAVLFVEGISYLAIQIGIPSALILLISVLRTKELRANHLMFSGVFYLIFIGVVCWAMN